MMVFFPRPYGPINKTLVKGTYIALIILEI